MKIITIIVISASMFASECLFAQQQTNEVVSCCSGKEARCTGSAYCTACTNCSSCKYCNSGGTCGVCSSRYRSSESNKSKRKKASTSSTPGRPLISQAFTLEDESNSDYYLDEYIVIASKLNMRYGPGTNYDIMEGLYKGHRLVIYAKYSGWAKVKVKASGNIGFVSMKYLERIN